MAGLVESGLSGDLRWIVGGVVVLSVLLWAGWRWIGRDRPVALAQNSAVATAGEPGAAEPVVLFKAYPGEAQFDVREDGGTPGRHAQVVAPIDPVLPVQVSPPAAVVATVVAVEPVVEPAVVVPVRRRPRPAWELAVDGQTPGSLLARAHEHLAVGNTEEAADQLRACARLASKLKEVAVEAVARLELGDLAQSHGDMTTACEHWQLARSLYAELKREDEVKASVKRMEKAGCPTDWVLTKF